MAASSAITFTQTFHAHPRVTWKKPKPIRIGCRRPPPLEYLRTTAISVASSFIATLFTAPMNATKILSIENNLNTVSDVVRHLGASPLAKLYRGYWTGVLKFAPRHAIEHTLYDVLHRILHPTLAGCIATTSSTTLLQPFDNIHTRRVLCRPGISHATLFNGVTPAMAQSALNGVIWYASLNHLRPHIDNPFLLCGVSAFLCNILLHPLDVIKTHCSIRDANALATTRHLLATHGPAGLFKGFPMVMITSIPSHTIAYGTYVGMKKYFGDSGSSGSSG